MSSRLVLTQALQEILLSQTRLANFILLYAVGSGFHVVYKYRETITQNLNVTRGVPRPLSEKLFCPKDWLWRDFWRRLETFGTQCFVNQRGLCSEISWQATSFESADKAEWLVQLICNLKRLPPTFWYSSAATCLLSLQIAQRFGVLGSLELAINYMFRLDVQLEVETTLMNMLNAFKYLIKTYPHCVRWCLQQTGRSSIGKRILQWGAQGVF